MVPPALVNRSFDPLLSEQGQGHLHGSEYYTTHLVIPSCSDVGMFSDQTIRGHKLQYTLKQYIILFLSCREVWSFKGQSLHVTCSHFSRNICDWYQNIGIKTLESGIKTMESNTEIKNWNHNIGIKLSIFMSFSKELLATKSFCHFVNQTKRII